MVHMKFMQTRKSNKLGLAVIVFCFFILVSNKVIDAFSPIQQSTILLARPSINQRKQIKQVPTSLTFKFKDTTIATTTSRNHDSSSLQMLPFSIEDTTLMMESLPTIPSLFTSLSLAQAELSSSSLLPSILASSISSIDSSLPVPLTTLLTSTFNFIITQTTFWSISIMLTIISLLVLWEESIHKLRTTLPPTLTPIIDSILGEIGGLGFIGLTLEVFATSNPERGLGRILSEISETYLGQEEILIESFEALHTAFFEVGIGFFIVIGTVVYAVLVRINQLSDISSLALDTDGDGEVSLNELADALNVQAMIVDVDGDGIISEEECMMALRQTKKRSFIEEAMLSVEMRASEILLIREQFLEQQNLKSMSSSLSSSTFQIEKYFEEIFAHNLEEMVELSPLTWLPLVPLISLLDTVDLSKDVVGGFAGNAALTSGCFITSPWFAVTSVFVHIIGIFWCIVNYWKVKEVKDMLIPALVKDVQNSNTTMLPPRYIYDEIRSSFNSSPEPIATIERIFGGKPHTNNHEYLFGAAGKEGPELYRYSIKLHTWTCVAQIVFLFGQIVLPDFYTWSDYSAGVIGVDEIGDIDWLVPELSLYFTLVVSSIVQLLLAPSVFLNYCTATSIEEMTKPWALEEAKKGC